MLKLGLLQRNKNFRSTVLRFSPKSLAIRPLGDA